ncbi:hypothetical protein JR338_01940 [Chloroflexota bacterium]|nr:hypothetical protein JR338_01940 [Chloroflexota bacterium]
METFLSYIFADPIPLPWLIQDTIVLILSLVLVYFIIRYQKRPFITILELVSFVFLYASIYENAASVIGLYSFGRSYLMVGSVPLTVPLIEGLILITGFWLLDKTNLPNWTKPPIIGLFGMLQDFSLDPLAIRQVFETTSGTSARWNWYIHSTDANILDVPVFNFPGWMLIMFYASVCLLIGRSLYKKSGEKLIVGLVYPVLAMVISLLLMFSPLSTFLLWLEPFYAKGEFIEWVLLAFHLIFPSVLLLILWKAQKTKPYTYQDLPIFLIPFVLHLSDITFTILGGFTEILWIVILASMVHLALLATFWLFGKKKPKPV